MTAQSSSAGVKDRWERIEDVIDEAAKAGAAAFKERDAERAAYAAARMKRLEGHLDRALRELDRCLAAIGEDRA